MRRLFPAAAVLLALSACGSRQVAVTGVAENAAPAPLAAVPVQTTPAAKTEVDAAIAAVRAQASPGTPGVSGSGTEEAVDYGDDFGPGENNTMALQVSLASECAEPGETMRATATTVAGSRLAFAASYSSNDFVPNFTYVPGEGNPTGTFTWAWEITPTTPRGDSLLTVVASKGKKGASYRLPFRVAEIC